MTDLVTLGFKADTSGLTKAQRELDKLSAYGGKVDATTAAVSGLGRAATALGATMAATFGVQSLGRQSDAWKNLSSQIRQVTNNEQELLAVRNQMIQVAQDTRTDIEATTKLYSSLARATADMGISTQEQIDITKTINNLFLSSGASAEQASAAITQLGQALSAGALRGDEFNSVAENAPRIMDALAVQLGMTRGELRDFAATGGITAEILVKALKSYGGAAQEAADMTERTLAQSMVIASNKMVEFAGKSSTLNGSFRALGDTAVTVSTYLANNVQYVENYFGRFSLWADDVNALSTALGQSFAKALDDSAKTFPALASNTETVLNQIIDGFKTLPDTLRTFVQLMGVELAYLIDIGSNYGYAFAMSIQAEFVALIDKAKIWGVQLGDAINPFSDGAIDYDSQIAAIEAKTKQVIDSIYSEAARKAEISREIRIGAISDVLSGFEMEKKAYQTSIGLIDEQNKSTVDLNKTKAKGIDLTTGQSTAIKKLGDDTDEWAKLTEESLNRIDQSFADVWYNILDGADNVFGSLINSFKRMLAEMAHAAITKPIMLNIQQSLIGAFGSAGGVGGLASGASSMLGLGSSIVGLGSMIGGAGLGAFGSGLGASLGYLGTGQFAAMGSLTSGMAGAGSVMGTIGAALPIVAGIAAAAMAIDKVSGGGLFGTKFKETERAISLAFGGGNASAYSESTEKRKRSLFRGTKTRTSTSAIDTSAINEAFDSIEQAIIAGSQILGVNGAEAALENFTTSLRADIKDKSEQEVQQIINDWISSTTNNMVDAALGGFLGDLQREGEPLVDTLQRVVVQTEVFNSVIDSLWLNFEGTSQAAALAADNLVNLVGGLDQFAALNNQLASFASWGDQWNSAYKDIYATFTELGMTIPRSREAFYDLMQGIDLSTSSGQELYATLLKLVPNLDKWYSLEDERDREWAQKQQEKQRILEQQAQAEQRLNDQRQNLTIRLLEAQGKSEEALALSRQLELAALDDSLKAIMMQIYAEQDKAKALEEAQRKQEEIIEKQKQALDELYATLVDNVLFAENEVEKARDAELARLELVIDKAQEAYNLELEAINVQREAYYQLIDDLTAKADSAAVMLDKARNVELIGINTQRQAFEQLTQQLQNNSSVAQSALEKSLNAELAKYDALAQAAQDSASAEIAAINNAANARLSALNAERSIVASVANQLGAAARGVSFKQALDAARRGDFEAASRITSGADYSDATSAKIGAAREAFALAEIGRLADAQLSDIDRQIAAQESFTASQVAAIESGTAAQLAQIEADKKAVEDQIKALLGIDDSVLSLDVAMAQYQKAQDELNAQIGSDTLDKLQAQEDALNAQIDGLLGIDNSVLGLADAIAQYNAAQSELNTALNADTLAQLQAQEDAAKALLDETIKQTQEQADLLNKQIDELLNIDNSVMALNDAITLLLNERKALADLEYDKQVEQLNAQVEQIAAQQETTLAVYNVVSALEDMPIRIGNAVADVREPIYQTPPIVIFPPTAESATAKEISSLREEMAYAQQSIAKSSATTAKILQRIEIDGLRAIP
jgi:tape measure domain-containing protein